LRRKEQRRLLLFVALLGGTLLLFTKAANPELWSAAFRSLGFASSKTETGANSRTSGGADSPGSDAAEHEYQPYIHTEAPKKEPGTIEILSEYQRQQIAEGKNRFPGVDTSLLGRVRDNRPHNRRRERPAWLNLFGVLKVNQPEFIDGAARDDVGYRQLFRQPDEFRGQLISLSGSIQRVEKVPFGENDLGIDSFYRVVLKVQAGISEARPVFAFVLELPDGFPVQYDMNEEATIAGFFYKKVPYARMDGETELAPVMLARHVQWQPEVAPPPVPVGPVVAISVGIAAVVLLSVWYFNRPGPAGDADDGEIGFRDKTSLSFAASHTSRDSS